MTVATTVRVGAATAAPGALDACVTRAASAAGFNGSVLLARGDETVVARSFGAANAQGTTPITASTRFNIASVGKLFTMAAIGILAERGKVDLDAPIGRYLTVDESFAAITIRQMLTHTSGLGDFLRRDNFDAVASAKTATDLLPLALAAPPAFPPGSKTAYSNSGYVVLGAIIEKVSGLPYTEFVQREILAPIGMTETRATGESAATPLTRLSMQGGALEHPQPSPMPAIPASPAGGWFSTASDMLRFLGAVADHRLLRADTTAALFPARAHAPARIGHNGGFPGGNAEVWLFPDGGWRLVVLSNYDPPGATRMAAVLEAAMLSAESDAACTAALAAPPPPTPGVIVRLPSPR